MGIKDPHDKRTFRHFAKLDGNGNVVAIVEVHDTTVASANGDMVQLEPVDGVDALYVDVTDIHPYDFTGVKTTKANVTAKNKAAIKTDLAGKNKIAR